MQQPKQEEKDHGIIIIMYDKAPFLPQFINLPMGKKVFYVTFWIVLAALLFCSRPLSYDEDGSDTSSLAVVRTVQTPPNKAHNNNNNDPNDATATTTTALTPYPCRPSIAWLLSFPNSGTSYTLANTNQVSQRLVATNYNVAGRSESEHFPMYEKGPFLLNTQDEFPMADNLLPESYLLTKTHCAAYCVDCPPGNFVHWSVEAFIDGCRTTKEKQAQHDYDKNNTATTTLHKTMYPAAWVTRAVHLMRNPFDNLVARMHLSMRDQGNAVVADDRQTLLTWCHQTVDSDDFFHALDPSLMDSRTLVLLQQLPCPAEWYRWIQWHNLALQMTHDVLQIPVHYLFYEDYTSQYNQTLAALLDFLQLSPAALPLPFVPGKAYRHLYTPTERQGAAQVVRALATPPCWERVKHYFWDKNTS